VQHGTRPHTAELNIRFIFLTSHLFPGWVVCNNNPPKTVSTSAITLQTRPRQAASAPFRLADAAVQRKHAWWAHSHQSTDPSWARLSFASSGSRYVYCFFYFSTNACATVEYRTLKERRLFGRSKGYRDLTLADAEGENIVERYVYHGLNALQSCC
jgi:hypothetical protein